jgi:hypothetical protein
MVPMIPHIGAAFAAFFLLLWFGTFTALWFIGMLRGVFRGS